MSRESVYTALFDRIKDLPGLVTASRRLKHWTDVSTSEMPAIFIAQRNESISHGQGLNAISDKYADIYIYVSNQGDISPSTALNQMLDSIESAMQPDNPIRNTLTLGGLVRHCRIEGTIETDEGTLGDIAVAIVPIRIFSA